MERAELARTEVAERAPQPSYVLITPARNEEAFIEKTIESMIRQTVLPMKWVIVDDGSTDKTRRNRRRYLRTMSLDGNGADASTAGSQFRRQRSKLSTLDMRGSRISI